MGLLTSGKGTMRLELDDHAFSPGDSLTGRIHVHLEKKVKSKGIRVKLTATQKRIRLDLRDNDLMDRDVETLFEAIVDVEGPQELEEGDHGPYEFSIRIPTNIDPNRGKMGGLLGKARGLLDKVTGGDSDIRWNLHVEVDIKAGWDLHEHRILHVA